MSDIYPVVGIDQSLTCSGVVILRDAADHTAVALVPLKRGVKRLLEIETALRELIPEKTQVVVMEGYAFQARGKVFALGELGGIIKRLVHISGIRMLIVPPSTLKKFVLGTGIGQKNKMMLGVFKKWGVEFDTDDECDAYALAKAGALVLQYEAEVKLEKQEVEICKAVLKHTKLVLMEDEDA